MRLNLQPEKPVAAGLSEFVNTDTKRALRVGIAENYRQFTLMDNVFMQKH